MSESPTYSIERLLRDEAKSLRALARAILRDEHGAEDAVQDAAFSAWRASSPRIERPAGWLRTLVRNFALKRHRESGRRETREAAAARAEAMPSAAELAERAELSRRLADAVASLAEPYRATIMLHYFEELSSAAIARRERIPASTVRVRLMRALELLRCELDAQDCGRREEWRGALAAFAGRTPMAPALGLVAAGATIVIAGALLFASARPTAENPGAVAAGPRQPASSGGIVPTTIAVARIDEDADARALIEAARHPPLPPVPPASIRGRAIRVDGGPASSALVRVLDPEAGDRELAATRADDDGDFAIGGVPAQRPLVVEISGGGEAFHEVRPWLPGSNELGAVLLERILRIRGRVVGLEGVAVAGARVILAGGSTRSSTTSDEAGRFELDEVLPGLGEWDVSAPGLALVDAPAVRFDDGRNRRDGDDREVVLRLAASASIAGVVRDEAGEPLARVVVSAESDLGVRSTGTTDESGSFRLELPATREATLRLQKPGWYREDFDAVTVAAPLAVTLRRGHALGVRLVDAATGRPVEAATVAIERAHGRDRPERDERGRFRNVIREAEIVRNADGSVTAFVPCEDEILVRASAPGFAPSEVACVALPPSPRGERDLVATLERRRPLVIRVRDRRTGAAVDGARVLACLGARDPSARRFTRTYGEARDPDGMPADSLALAFADAAGIAALFALQPGRIHLRVDAEGLAPAWIDAIEIDSEDEGALVDAWMDEGSVIEGIALDTSGRPLDGAIVRLTSEGGERTDARSTRGGAFRFERLAPGRYDVRMHRRGEPEAHLVGRVLVNVDDHGNAGLYDPPSRAPGISERGPSAPVTVELGSGVTARVELRARRPQGGQARGRVLVGGVAIAGVQLHFAECVELGENGRPLRAERHASALTDFEGCFIVEALAPSRWRLEVLGPAEPLHPSWKGRLADRGPFEVTSDTSLELEIDVPLATLRGRVVDAHTGLPIARAVVTARGHGEHPVDRDPNPTSARCDEEGRFQFDGLPFGDYAIGASALGYHGASTRARTGPDPATAIELALDPGGWVRLTPCPGSAFDVESLRAEISLLPEIPDQHAGSVRMLSLEEGAFWLYLGRPESVNPSHVGPGGRLRASVELSIPGSPADIPRTTVVVETLPDRVTEFEIDG